MGMVYADVELINAQDLSDAKRSKIGDEEIRRSTAHPTRSTFPKPPTTL